MDLIGQFLKKFSNLTLPDETLKKAFIALVEKELGITLQRDQVIIKHKVITVLNVASGLKSELFLRKQKLLTRLQEELGAVAPEDIR